MCVVVVVFCVCVCVVLLLFFVVVVLFCFVFCKKFAKNVFCQPLIRLFADNLTWHK